MNKSQLAAALSALCPNVYFQPPASVSLVFPALVYARTKIDKKPAENSGYLIAWKYNITVITKKPDDPLLGLVLSLPMTSHVNHFTKDNLHHDVFSIVLT